jgi:hypothetical protein
MLSLHAQRFLNYIFLHSDQTVTDSQSDSTDRYWQVDIGPCQVPRSSMQFDSFLQHRRFTRPPNYSFINSVQTPDSGSDSTDTAACWSRRECFSLRVAHHIWIYFNLPVMKDDLCTEGYKRNQLCCLFCWQNSWRLHSGIDRILSFATGLKCVIYISASLALAVWSH